MTSANICRDIVVMNCITTKYYFHKLYILSEELLVRCITVHNGHLIRSGNQAIIEAEIIGKNWLNKIWPNILLIGISSIAWYHVDDFVQRYGISSALAMEILQSFT